MRAPRTQTLLAASLIVLSVAQIFFASQRKSAVYDEPGDIAAGLSYWTTGQVSANPQQPPLVKELAGLAVWLAGIRLPEHPDLERMMAGAGGEIRVGGELLAKSGPDRVMPPARLPMILLSAVLGLLIYLWGRQIVGETAALAALFLYALDPTVLAHSYLVTMDVPLAVLTLLFLYALWNYLQCPGGERLVWCGLALGAVLATKFSAVFLLPIAAVLMLAAVRHPAAGAPVPQRYGAAARALIAMSLLAMLVLQTLYFSPTGVYLYSAGMQHVNADHDPTHLAFLAGGTSPHFLSYFAVAYLLKEPLPNILLAGLGLLAVLRNKSLSGLAKLFLLLPPAVLFAVHSLWADDLGIRYILPVLPFAWLSAGAGVAWLLSLRALWPRLLVGVLAIWTVITAAGIYPDHLAYFNEAACMGGHWDRIGLDGGSRCGPLWLDDSNVDWGQGLKQLKQWADGNARGRKIRLAYFGTVDPAAYGLAVEKIPFTALQTPTPGLYVVSGHWVAQWPAYGAQWMATAKPVAIIGHSLYVFER